MSVFSPVIFLISRSSLYPGDCDMFSLKNCLLMVCLNVVRYVFVTPCFLTGCTDCDRQKGESKMTQAELLQRIKECIQTLYGPRFRGLVLYGSVARGDASETSDIDALCLLEGPDTGNDLWAVTNALYPLQLEFPDRDLHIIPVDVAEYEAGDYALYREARREGVLL